MNMTKIGLDEIEARAKAADESSIHGLDGRIARGKFEATACDDVLSLIAAVRYFADLSVCNLQRYVDEEVFRFNSRKGDDADRFASVMGRTVGRRVTWRQLCEIDGCGFMGLE